MNQKKQRCDWCTKDSDYIKYHDEEWGVPLHDDQKLFELLCLEGAQAGLSWLTILKKRDGYREAFDHFNAEKMAVYDEAKLEQLKQDSRIVRNRLKIRAFVGNAQAYLAIRKSGTSFADYLWTFVNHTRIQNNFSLHSDIPANTPLSDAMSLQLKKAGFKFVGSTICYAFMQSSGMVNDHLISCFRHSECQAENT